MKKSPTLFEGTILALVISIAASLFFNVMSSLLSGGFVFRILISLICLIYLLYLFSRSQQKTGKITIFSLWLLIALLNHLITDSVLLYITIHISAIWLIRSLYFYNSVLSSLIDLFVTITALASSIISWNHTGSLLLSIWCFLLVQSLFVFIPRQAWGSSKYDSSTIATNTTFEKAYHNAEAALKKLNTHYSFNRRHYHEQ